jgi:hypothetical protein
VTKKYPLEPLRQVRDDKLDRAQRALAHANGKLGEARTELERREREQVATEEAAQRIRAAETDRLERGELSASDLMRAAAWSVGAGLQKQAKMEQVQAARAATISAEEAALARRSAMENAQAEKELVERNRHRWMQAENTKALLAEEQAAEEAHLARRHRGGS